MRIIKLFSIVVGVLIIVMAGLIGGWGIWARLQDPLEVIDYGIENLKVVSDFTYPDTASGQKRIYHDVTLWSGSLDTLKITISFPETIPERGLPVSVILGGLETGRKSLQYIPDHGNNAVIAYQYPYSPRYWYDGAALEQIPIIRNAALKAPAQIEALCRWAVQQSWSNGKPVNVLGYSFGALFVPAVYHLAVHHQLTLGPGVIAYGGANLYELLRANFRKINPFVRPFLAWFAATALYPGEPELHLPHLKGKFLIINGKNDHQVPRECWRLLHKLTPEPKTIIFLNEGHMRPRKVELNEKIIRISKEWLLRRDAINP
ncbi:MAG: hypothetical protein GWN59_03685 [Calditrichae bacterium]|nr:hypothetical protein [Calditrichia bacterium]